MIKEAYHNSEYWNMHPSFHEEDQDFKFNNISELIDKGIPSIPRNIIDVGCGSGKFAYLMSQKYKVNVTGIDLDPKVIDYASATYKNENLEFRVQELKDMDSAGIGILADVFEHVEDYYGFLRLVATKFDYVVFNIPLDLSIINLLRNGPLKMKKEVFHLHYFYEGLVLQILKDLKYEIIDYKFSENFKHYLKTYKLSFFQRFYYHTVILLSKVLGKRFTSLIFGCYSLTVLCKPARQ